MIKLPCNQCGDILPYTKEYFKTRKVSKTGLEQRCKKCDSLNRKELREAKIKEDPNYKKQFTKAAIKKASKKPAKKVAVPGSQRRYIFEYWLQDKAGKAQHGKIRATRELKSKQMLKVLFPRCSNLETKSIQSVQTIDYSA